MTEYKHWGDEEKSAEKVSQSARNLRAKKNANHTGVLSARHIEWQHTFQHRALLMPIPLGSTIQSLAPLPRLHGDSRTDIAVRHWCRDPKGHIRNCSYFAACLILTLILFERLSRLVTSDG